MSQFLHVSVSFNPVAIKLSKLANFLHYTMCHLLHSVISVRVYCFAFSLLTSPIHFSSLLDILIIFAIVHSQNVQ